MDQPQHPQILAHHGHLSENMPQKLMLFASFPHWIPMVTAHVLFAFIKNREKTLPYWPRLLITAISICVVYLKAPAAEQIQKHSKIISCTKKYIVSVHVCIYIYMYMCVCVPHPKICHLVSQFRFDPRGWEPHFVTTEWRPQSALLTSWQNPTFTEEGFCYKMAVQADP